MKERKYVQLVRLDKEEVRKIACAILGASEDTSINDLNGMLIDEYDILLQDLTFIASRLLPLVHVSYDEKTKEQHKGFALDGKWLAERKCMNNK